MASPSLRVQVPLRWSDMDAYGHVNNVQFLRLLEDARVIGFREWFGEAPTMLDEGVVVARHEIEYRAPLSYRLRAIEVDMWVTRVQRGRLRPRLRRADPEDVGTALYAVAETGLVLYDFAAPARAGSGRAPARRWPATSASPWPSGGVAGEEVLRLADVAALADLGRYAARARALDERARCASRPAATCSPPGSGCSRAAASSPRGPCSACAPSPSPSRRRPTPSSPSEP